MRRDAERAAVVRRRIVGLDGCRGGWVVAEANEDLRDIVCRRIDSFGDLFDAERAPALVAVDIPIGLLGTGVRDCDKEARRVLGPRRSSVFNAPIRPVLNAASYEEACGIGRKTEGKALSRQAWGILPKVKEVDRFLRKHSHRRALVREVHPELAFHLMNGGVPLSAGKKRSAGREQRLGLVRQWAGRAINDALARPSALGAKADDILDAFAVLWSARRLLEGEAVVLPSGAAPRDRFGLRMEITA